LQHLANICELELINVCKIITYAYTGNGSSASVTTDSGHVAQSYEKMHLKGSQ